MVWYIVPGTLVLWLAVLCVRALLFRPSETAVEPMPELPVDAQTATEHFQQLLRCKTVSYIDETQTNEEEFARFEALLPTLYPAVHAVCEKEKIGSRALLYRWKGKTSGGPTVLMAHYDVVPVTESEWKHPPFAAEISEGMLWGRGTLDTKGTLLSVMEGAETLIQQGFVPECDLYFAFAGDEEVMGHGAQDIVQTLKNRGVHPAMVLDEGGAIVQNVFPGVKEEAALIGIAEKGGVDIDIIAQTKGGHASVPPAHSALGKLGRAVARVESRPMRFTLTKPARELFDRMGRHSTFAYKLIFANLWCFAPVLNLLCKKSGGELNALVRTTCAFTRAWGSDAYNVMPSSATVGANVRLICGETIKGMTQYLSRIMNDNDISLRVIHGNDPSAISKTGDQLWNRVDRAIRAAYSGVLVSPYLMLACSDSRHYDGFCDHVYRFSGMRMTKEERGLIHNANERIPVDYLPDTIRFYARVMQQC